MNNKDNSAYPHNYSVSIQHGLTKREYFAAMAMQGILARACYRTGDAARQSIMYADALLKELEK
jgi:hypothetical protein